MKSFQARNPVPIGIIGIVVLILAGVAALNSDKLPLVGGGTTYVANVREAAGLKSQDGVRIAGVKVGAIDDVEVENDHVKVTFTVKDAFVGDQSQVSIKLQTFLGQKYLAVDSRGADAQDPGKTMSEDTANSVYLDVQDAFSGLNDTVRDIDTDQLAQSFDVLSTTFSGTPQHVRGALDGLSALSKTISSRDAELGNLLSNTRRISGVLADRDKQVQKLLSDGNLLLAEIQRRKGAIDSLLTGTQNLATQLSGLVDDNKAQLRPVLESLDKLSTLLRENRDSLGKGIERLAPFVRLFNNTIGNGRWFDSFVCGLIPPSVSVLNTKGCVPPIGPNDGGGTR